MGEDQTARELAGKILAYRDAVNLLGWPSRIYPAELAVIEAAIALAERVMDPPVSAEAVDASYAAAFGGIFLRVSVLGVKEQQLDQLNHPAVPIPGSTVRTCAGEWVVRSIEQIPKDAGVGVKGYSVLYNYLGLVG